MTSGDAWPGAQVGVWEGALWLVLPCVCQGSGGGPHGARWDTDEGDKEDGSPGFEGPGFCTWEPPYLPIGGVRSKAPHRLSHWGHKPKSGSELGPNNPDTQVARPLAPPSPACLQAFPNIQSSCGLLFFQVSSTPVALPTNKHLPSLQSPTQKSPALGRLGDSRAFLGAFLGLVLLGSTPLG